jgi:hypothetical protein
VVFVVTSGPNHSCVFCFSLWLVIFIVVFIASDLHRIHVFVFPIGDFHCACAFVFFVGDFHGFFLKLVIVVVFFFFFSY